MAHMLSCLINRTNSDDSRAHSPTHLKDVRARRSGPAVSDHVFSTVRANEESGYGTQRSGETPRAAGLDNMLGHYVRHEPEFSANWEDGQN